MKKKTGKKILIVGLFVAGLAFSYKLGESGFGKKLTTINNKKVLAVYLEGDDGEYTLSSSNKFPTDGYVLNTEKSTCTNGGTLSQNAETKAISMSTSNKSECNLYFEKKSSSGGDTIIAKSNDSSITDYNSGNKGEMFAFSHPATEQTEALTDYRYIGNTPNNYIDFNDETWRIIGMFTVETESGEKQQLMKIIRDESIGNLRWDSSSSNEWSKASLKTLLNGDYYNQTGSYTSTATIKGLNATARSQVANVKWYLGGSIAYEKLGGPDYYAFERGTATYKNSRTTSIIQKVGLMYPSDYIYTYANGIDNTCYTNGYNCSSGTPANGWLFKSEALQWFLSPHAGYEYNCVFFVDSSGRVINGYGVTNTIAVRPTVFLASDVVIVGGDGSSGNHYKLG